MQQKIVVLKTTVNVKIILLIEIIITIKISITKRMIAGLTEVVIKVIITVLKMTYKENSMEKKETQTRYWSGKNAWKYL